MPVAGICFLPLRAAVAGVLTTTLFIVVVAMLPPGAGRATPALAPPLAGDCGAGAADLTGVRGTGLPFGACNTNHPDFMFKARSGSVHLHAAAYHPCSDHHTPADQQRGYRKCQRWSSHIYNDCAERDGVPAESVLTSTQSEVTTDGVIQQPINSDNRQPIAQRTPQTDVGLLTMLCTSELSSLC